MQTGYQPPVQQAAGGDPFVVGTNVNDFKPTVCYSAESVEIHATEITVIPDVKEQMSNLLMLCAGNDGS